MTGRAQHLSGLLRHLARPPSAQGAQDHAWIGDHLQYSVFECQLTRTDLAKRRHLLSEIINHREDRVLFVDLGPATGRGDRVISALGRAYSPIDSPCIVVDGYDDSRMRIVGTARSEQAARRSREKRALLSANPPAEVEVDE